MWGHTLQFWQTTVFWLWAMTAVGGGVAVTASFASSVVSYYISDTVQRASDAAAQRSSERVAALEVDLERERVQRLRLEAELSPRHLTPEQHAALVSALKAGPHLPPVQLIWLGDNEPETYTHEIAAAFRDAGIETKIDTNLTITSATGINIFTGPGSFGDALKAAFDKAGVPAHTVTDESTTPYIVVGFKPLPTTRPQTGGQ